MIQNLERKKEAFLRIAYVLHSHWKVSSEEEKKRLDCKIHTRIFDVLIPDEYVIYGESKNGKGHREHVVPCAYIRDNSLKMFNDGLLIEDVAKMIEKNLIIVHITQEERKIIDFDLGYKTDMPKPWDFGDDPLARLKLANINIIKYEDEK